MKTLILVVVNWLHLIATVIWVGGITFVLFIALPSAKELLGVEAGKIMGIISRRFTLYANYSILLLIVSGIAIVALSGGLSSIRGSDPIFSGSFVLKHIAVLMMVAIHFYRGLALTGRIKSAPPSKQSGLQRLSLTLVKVNFTLGLGVLLLSAVMASC